jgi:hypothetical protein
MFELNVYFWGLICHVDPDKNNRANFAAVVRTQGSHTPRVLFQTNDSFVLKGDVHFKRDNKIREGVAHVDVQAFDRAVPRLEAVLGGALLIDEDNAFRFNYPAGDATSDLLVADEYDYLAIHKSKGSRQTRRLKGPVARIIRLRVPLDEATIITFRGAGTDGKTVTVERQISTDTCILIENLESTYLYDAGDQLVELGNDLIRKSKEEAIALGNRFKAAGQGMKLAAISASAQGEHFAHYSQLIAGGDTVVVYDREKVAKTPPTFACDWIANYVQTIDERYFPRGASRPECGNTNWP